MLERILKLFPLKVRRIVDPCRYQTFQLQRCCVPTFNLSRILADDTESVSDLAWYWIGSHIGSMWVLGDSDFV
jgi:hypothetical protein